MTPITVWPSIMLSIEGLISATRSVVAVKPPASIMTAIGVTMSAMHMIEA